MVRARGRSHGAQAGEATREALLRAGTRLFAERGFDGVSVEEIAREARVNKALVSYHFGGKRALYTAIMRTTLVEVQARLLELSASKKAPGELLVEFLGVFHEIATVQRPFFPALLLREMLAPGAPPGGAFNTEVAPKILSLLQASRAIFERGAREGVFRAVDPFLAHLSILGSLIFYYATEPTRQRLVREGRVPLPLPATEAFPAHMREMVLFGLTGGARVRTRKAGREGARR